MHKISVPASKSYLQRALVFSALSKGTSVLHNVSWCNDSLAVRLVIEQLGVKIHQKDNDLIITSEGISFLDNRFNVGESGLAMRMLAPVLALLGEAFVLDGEGSLRNRPVQMIVDALFQLGVEVVTTDGCLPLFFTGKLQPGNVKIDGSISSQLLTGLLMALPLVDGSSLIHVNGLKSKPYIDMTLDLMRQFGVDVRHDNYRHFYIEGGQSYKMTECFLEGDWSGAAFFLVYGSVVKKIEVINLNLESLQADRVILEVVKKVGAVIEYKSNSVCVSPSSNLRKSFQIDASDCPDLFPPLVCLASQCKGRSEIKGVSRLMHKESNRGQVLQCEFFKMGINIDIDGDVMYVTGCKPNSATINSHNDHRIAMAGALMNHFCDGDIAVVNKESVNKSYPDFLEQIKF